MEHISRKKEKSYLGKKWDFLLPSCPYCYLWLSNQTAELQIIFPEFFSSLRSYIVNNRKLPTDTQFHLKYENQADKETILPAISLSLLF